MKQKHIWVTIAVNDEQPKVVEFTKESLTLGTNPDNDIVLQDGIGVPKQAYLSLKDTELILETAGNVHEIGVDSGDMPPIIESGTSLKLGNNILLTFEVKEETETSQLNSLEETSAPKQTDISSSSEDKDEVDFVPPNDFDPFDVNTTAPKPEIEVIPTAKPQEILQTPSRMAQHTEVPSLSTSPNLFPTNDGVVTIVKTRDREYCIGCLELLDLHDKRPEYRQIVQCTNCGSLYHGKTWEGLRACVHCDNKHVRQVQINPPTSLQVLQKTIAIPPKTRGEYKPPSTKDDSKPRAETKGTANTIQSIRQMVKNASLWLRDSAIMLMFVALISAISVYFMRIIVDLPPASRTNLEDVLDAILRSPLPQSDILIAGATLTLSFVLVLFPSALYNRLGYPSLARRLMRLLAVAVLSLLVGIVVLRLQFITPQDLTQFGQQRQTLFQRFAYIGMAAAVLTVLGTPVYRKLTRRVNSPAYNPEKAGAGWRIFSMARFFAVLLALLVMVYLALNTPFVRQWIMIFTRNQNQKVVPEAQYVAFGMALASAAALLVYFPSSYKAFTRRLLPLRLIGIVVLLALAGSIYASMDQASSLLAAALVGMVGIVALLPVQRAFG